MAVEAADVVASADVRLGKFAGYDDDEKLRVAELALATVNTYASAAPDGAAREAALRVYGYLLSQPTAALREDAEGNSYTPTRTSPIVASGAGGVLAPWRSHRAGRVGA